MNEYLYINDPIYKETFYCNTNQMALYTQEELELFGMTLNQIEDKTQLQNAEKVTVKINILQIIEIFLNGYYISLVNIEDIKNIKTILNNFINKIQGNYGTSIHDRVKHKSSEIDDIIMFKDILDEMYPDEITTNLSPILTFGQHLIPKRNQMGSFKDTEI